LSGCRGGEFLGRVGVRSPVATVSSEEEVQSDIPQVESSREIGSAGNAKVSR